MRGVFGRCRRRCQKRSEREEGGDQDHCAGGEERGDPVPQRTAGFGAEHLDCACILAALEERGLIRLVIDRLLEGRRKFLRRLVAIGGLFRKRAVEHPLQVRGEIRDGRGRLVHVLEQHAHGCVRIEGDVAGQDFVQHDGERVDVGALVGLISAGLFGTHVGRRPRDLAGGGLFVGI